MSLQLNGTDGVTFNDGSEQWAAASPYGLKNLIINGNMQIAQRGTSATGITTSGYYTVDRFDTILNTAGTWTMTQDTDVPTAQGFASSVKYSCTTADVSPAAGDYFQIRQKIEGQNLQQLKKGTASAENLTLSFWIKSNKTGTYTMQMYDSDNARYICESFTISVADTWEKKTMLLEGDTSGALDNDNGNSLQVSLWFVAGSNFTSGTLQTTWGTSGAAAAGQTVNLADSTSNYINITGVQLEIGDTATPFENRMYSQELAMCQRYYYNTGGTIRYYKNSSNTAAEAYPLGFPVYMRVSPSMSFGTVSAGANTSTYSIAGASNQSVSVQITANGVVAGYARLDAQLIADAEL